MIKNQYFTIDYRGLLTQIDYSVTKKCSVIL